MSVEANAASEIASLGRDGGMLDAWIVPWDSAIFGVPVAEIRAFRLADAQDATEALAPFDAWATERGVVLSSARLDHEALHESMALEAAGFRFVEMVLGPRLEKVSKAVARLRAAGPTRALTIRPAEPADEPRLQAIAADAFTTGRFLLDWRLPREVSGERYAHWVRSSLASAAQEVVVGVDEGRIVGFFITETGPDGGVYWHLTAIAPDAQGQGYGLAMWAAMVERAAAGGGTSIESTISAHNLPVLSLYAGLGFRFVNARMTFHRLTGSFG